MPTAITFTKARGGRLGGEEVIFAPLADILPGEIFVTGYLGDTVWDKQPCNINQTMQMTFPAGTTLGEFRLRTGFVHLPLPLIGYVHHPDVVAISQSRELAPWSTGTAYDRPIARRLVESRNVPRALFGRTQMAITQPLWNTERLEDFLTPDSYTDFVAFSRDISPFRNSWDRWRFAVMHTLYKIDEQVNWRMEALLKRLHCPYRERHLIPKRYGTPRGRAGLTFHWGLERTMPRYQNLTGIAG